MPVSQRHAARPHGSSGPALTGARLEKTVIECAEPRVLAEFYATLLDMQRITDEPHWVVIGREPGMRELAFQHPERHPASARDPAYGAPEASPGGRDRDPDPG